MIREVVSLKACFQRKPWSSDLTTFLIFNMILLISFDSNLLSAFAVGKVIRTIQAVKPDLPKAFDKVWHIGVHVEFVVR